MNPQASRQAGTFKQIHKVINKQDHSSAAFCSDSNFTYELTQYLDGQVFFRKLIFFQGLKKIRFIEIYS